MSGLDPERLARLHEVMDEHVERDRVGGVAWLAARDGDVEVGATTKPIVAAGAMMLVEDCRLRLDDPVDELVPELAGRRVLVNPRGPIDGARVPVQLGGEGRHGVREGLGLFGVRDMTAVVELDQSGIGQRLRQPVGDGPERRVAGRAGDDESREGEGREV
jgi:Beta-lactamase